VFEAVDCVSFVQEPSFARSNYWLNALLLDEEVAERRDEVLEVTNDRGYMTRPAWRLMHRLPMYQLCPRMDLSASVSLAERLLNVPSAPNLLREGE
jgi:perosamine synthetase